MQIPLEVYYKDVVKSDALDSLIRDKVARLERVCDHITGCRVAVEKPNGTPRSTNPFRVRIDVTVPPGHEVVVSKEPGQNEKENPLSGVIRDAFAAAEKQLKKLVQVQRSEVKTHPEQEVRAIVTKIFPEEGYGFLQTVNGREIYFHKNSVINEQFENMDEGTGVRFFEEDGEKGPQASTVQIIN